MSWRFPKFPIKSGRIPDVDDTNANFYEVAEEVGGSLNEHNWGVGAITAKSDLAQDACFVWHSASGGPNQEHAQIAIDPDSTKVPERTAWRQIDDAKSTFTSPGCLLWIHASLQVVQDPDTSGGAGWADDSGFNFVLVGIEVDGYVIPESIVGGAEPDNDRAFGVFWGAMPLATDIVFPVGPGEHTVSIVVKTGAKKDGRGVHVDDAEIICLEMRR